MLFRQRVVVIERQERLAGFMSRLDVLCRGTQHPLPVRMKFIAEGTSHSGQAMAIYACPFAGCNCRQGWVRDRRTGRPIQLWAGIHRNGQHA